MAQRCCFPGIQVAIVHIAFCILNVYFSLRRKSWQQNKWSRGHECTMNAFILISAYFNISPKLFHETPKIVQKWLKYSIVSISPHTREPIPCLSCLMNSLQNVNNAPRHHATTIYTRWPTFHLPFYSFWLFFLE